MLGVGFTRLQVWVPHAHACVTQARWKSSITGASGSQFCHSCVCYDSCLLSGRARVGLTDRSRALELVAQRNCDIPVLPADRLGQTLLQLRQWRLLDAVAAGATPLQPRGPAPAPAGSGRPRSVTASLEGSDGGMCTRRKPLRERCRRSNVTARRLGAGR